MRLWRRLGPRILVTSALLAVLGTLGVNLMLARLTIAGAAARAGRFLVWAAHGELGRQCAASPETFLRVDDGFELWALDDRLRPSHPGAPAVPEGLLDALRGGDDHASAVGGPPAGAGGVLVQRVAAAGPCAVMVVRWERSEARLTEGLERVAAIVLVATLLAMALGLVLVVRPLARRIQRLEEAARKVGGDGGYVPLGRAPRDELDQVRAALDEAHARIVRGAEALEQKNRALVTHLSDVAHDLRTPIAALQLKLERLEAPDLGEAQRESERTAALADALYLEALCENLRFAATLREGLALEAAESDLGRAVLRVRDRLRALARQRGVALEVAVPDGEVRAPVAVVLETRGDRFHLRVADDGPGLPEAVRARLSAEGAAAAPSWDDAGGTGLGLRIVVALSARAGLDLAFRHPAEGGLEVSLEGPLAPAAPA